MSYLAKTSWKMDEIVTEGDLNRIEQGVKEAHEGVQASLPNTDGSVTDANIGSRTITDSEAPIGDEGTPTELWNWQAYMTKAITGEANWRTAPDLTLKDVQTMLEAATNAATAGTLVERDGSGRFKAAAPAAADDVARKAEVDAASAAAAVAQSTATAAVPKTGGEMIGPLNVFNFTGRKISVNSWVDLSANAYGGALYGNNCYTDGDDTYRYANTHVNLGARGLRISVVGVQYFDTGRIATTAGQAFTPNWQTVWHAGNDGTGSGLDADLIRGRDLTDQANHTNAAGLSAGLTWRNFGSGHRVVDNSNNQFGGGTTNAQNEWIPSYPVLMGYNGNQTYGVRVDSARIADSATNANYANNAGNADTVDGVHFRVSSGYLEYWDGSAWRNASGGIKSVQRNVSTITSPSTITIGISPVDMNKSFVTISSTASSSTMTAMAYGRLTSNTTLELSRNLNTSVVTTVAWEVVEFY